MASPAGGLSVAVAVGAATVLIAAAAAAAGFQRSTSASLPVSSGRLVAATAPSATPGCALLVPKVTLAWTPTVTANATGYRIHRRTGSGSFALVATVAGRTSSGYVDSPLAASTSYSYYVEAYVGSWTATTATVTATTALICL